MDQEPQSNSHGLIMAKVRVVPSDDDSSVLDAVRTQAMLKAPNCLRYLHLYPTITANSTLYTYSG